jgi:hypothetical protein
LEEDSGVKYPDLIREKRDIIKKAEQLLMGAKSTTEAFLYVAMTAMEPVVLSLAQGLDYKIYDTFQDGILLSRTFNKSILT